jgi:hypothetical protein
LQCNEIEIRIHTNGFGRDGFIMRGALFYDWRTIQWGENFFSRFIQNANGIG